MNIDAGVTDAWQQMPASVGRRLPSNGTGLSGPSTALPDLLPTGSQLDRHASRPIYFSAVVGFPALVKPNYQFEKRQRELEKKRKQEEKRLRDLSTKAVPEGASGLDTAALPVSTAGDDTGKAG